MRFEFKSALVSGTRFGSKDSNNWNDTDIVEETCNVWAQDGWEVVLCRMPAAFKLFDVQVDRAATDRRQLSK